MAKLSISGMEKNKWFFVFVFSIKVEWFKNQKEVPQRKYKDRPLPSSVRRSPESERGGRVLLLNSTGWYESTVIKNRVSEPFFRPATSWAEAEHDNYWTVRYWFDNFARGAVELHLHSFVILLFFFFLQTWMHTLLINTFFKSTYNSRFLKGKQSIQYE